MLERKKRFGNFPRTKNEQLEEFKEFRTFFPREIPYSGILTMPGININPIWRGAFFAPGSARLMDKLSKGQPLSKKESEEILKANENSISGTYEWQREENGMELKINIDNLDTSGLSASTDYMIAFLVLEEYEKIFSNIRAENIKFETQESSIIFGFPQIEQAPEQFADLYLYHPNFPRQRLRLWKFNKDSFLRA